MSVCGKLKKFTKKTLELMSLTISQDRRSIYKINCVLNTKQGILDFEVRIIPFTIASKLMKSLGINLTKYVLDLYPEKYKTLMRKTLNPNKDLYFTHREEDVISKLSKMIYR